MGRHSRSGLPTMSFLYSLPTTGAVNLTSIISDPTRAYVADLARANAARSRVRAALKEARRSELDKKDWAGCVTALQDYLPHIMAVIQCTENDSLFTRGQPVFSWRSTLSASSLKKGRVAISSFRYELAFVLLTYALALSNSATVAVQALGTYERDASVSEAQRKRMDEQVNAAAETLCRAAGVLKYLSETVIPDWEALTPDLRERPPEVTGDVTLALSKVCLADAERLAIRRLLSKSIAVAQATMTPGPPLPRSHPSPSLLAKLYLNVYTLYDAARSAAKAVGNSTEGRLRAGLSGSSGSGATGGGAGSRMLNSFKKDKQQHDTASSDASDGISSELRTYLSDGRAFSSSLSYKWLGVDAGESDSSGRTGEAIAWLNLARTGLLALQNKSRSRLLAPMRKGKVERGKRKDRLSEEIEDVEGFLNSYKRTNDTVLFQPVPAESTLLAQVPAGRSVLAIKPFAVPAPAFVSRRQFDQLDDLASAKLAAQTDGLRLKDEAFDDSDDDDDDSELGQPVQQSNYF